MPNRKYQLAKEKMLQELQKHKELFKQYQLHEEFMLRQYAGVENSQEEWNQSKIAFFDAYQEEADAFVNELNEATKDPKFNDKETLELELSVSEFMRDYRESRSKVRVDLAKLKSDNVNDNRKKYEHHSNLGKCQRWLYRNCDKSGYAYLGSAGGKREWVDSLLKLPDDAQMRAFYILEHGLTDKKDGAKKAEEADLTTYTPNLDKIKDQMIRSKFNVLSRANGSQFHWNRLSKAFTMAREIEKKKEASRDNQNVLAIENENVALDEQNPVIENQKEYQKQVQEFMTKFGIPEKKIADFTELGAAMMEKLAEVKKFEAANVLDENAGQEEKDDFNKQREPLVRAYGDACQKLKAEMEKDGVIMKAMKKAGEYSDEASKNDQFILGLTFAYSIATQGHDTAKLYLDPTKKKSDLPSMFVTLAKAMGADETSKAISGLDKAMDGTLGILGVFANGMDTINNASKMKKNWTTSLWWDKIKSAAQVLNPAAWTVKNGAAAWAAGDKFLKIIKETGEAAGEIAPAIANYATGVANGSEFLMGTIDAACGSNRYKRANHVKKMADELATPEIKAQLRADAKVSKRKNKWRGITGGLSIGRGAAGSAAFGLGLASICPAVVAALGAVGSAILTCKLFYLNHKNRISNNRKAIDAQIFAKDRELRGGNVPNEGQKKVRAIDELVKKRKKLLFEYVNHPTKNHLTSKELTYLNKIWENDKILKHAIRTDAAVKMGCMTQEDCRNKLNQQMVERAFRNVYLKDPNGLFEPDNIATKETFDKIYAQIKSDPSKLTENQKVRMAYKDILESNGIKVDTKAKERTAEHVLKKLDRAKSMI